MVPITKSNQFTIAIVQLIDISEKIKVEKIINNIATHMGIDLRHQSHESLADYCKFSNNYCISNTAILIPFLLYESDLDEYDYSE
ncbi:13997_t:CDS:2, partial [Gigaspora margarita]